MHAAILRVLRLRVSSRFVWESILGILSASENPKVTALIVKTISVAMVCLNFLACLKA